MQTIFLFSFRLFSFFFFKQSSANIGFHQYFCVYFFFSFFLHHFLVFVVFLFIFFCSISFILFLFNIVLLLFQYSFHVNWQSFVECSSSTTNQCTISRLVHFSKWHFDLLGYWKKKKYSKIFINSIQINNNNKRVKNLKKSKTSSKNCRQTRSSTWNKNDNNWWRLNKHNKKTKRQKIKPITTTWNMKPLMIFSFWTAAIFTLNVSWLFHSVYSYADTFV